MVIIINTTWTTHAFWQHANWLNSRWEARPQRRLSWRQKIQSHTAGAHTPPPLPHTPPPLPHVIFNGFSCSVNCCLILLRQFARRDKLAMNENRLVRYIWIYKVLIVVIPFLAACRAGQNAASNNCIIVAAFELFHADSFRLIKVCLSNAIFLLIIYLFILLNICMHAYCRQLIYLALHRGYGNGICLEFTLFFTRFLH